MNLKQFKRIKNPTEADCLALISDQRFSDYEYIPDHFKSSLEFNKKAVKIDYMILDNFEKQPVELCLAAVTKNGWALEFVKEQTIEICLAALKNDEHVYVDVKIVPNPDARTTIQNLNKLIVADTIKSIPS